MEKYDACYSTIENLIKSDSIEQLREYLVGISKQSDRGMYRASLIAMKPVIEKFPQLQEMYQEISSLLREETHPD